MRAHYMTTTLKVVFCVIMLSAVILNAAPTKRQGWYYGDERRLNLLETKLVGELPKKKMTFVECLSHFNERVRREKLPDDCEVMIWSDPTSLSEDGLGGIDLLTPGYLEDQGLLGVFGIDPKEPLREALARLNMRQFLGLIKVGFYAAIDYRERNIYMGYGWSSHSTVGLGNVKGTPSKGGGTEEDYLGLDYPREDRKSGADDKSQD